MADNVSIAAGDVIEVQLTSEKVVVQSAQGRRTVERPTGEINNRLRLFVKDLEGKEQTFDFEDTELPVRQGQRVAVVQTRLKRVAEPVNLMLFNLSSGESDTFEPGLHAHLGRTPFFNALTKALVIAAAIGLIFWVVSFYIMNAGAWMAGFAAAALAFLLFPLLLWLCRTWDRVSERMRYARARKSFIANMEGRVRVYAADAGG